MPEFCLPSVLDRLEDKKPGNPDETWDGRGLNLREYRAIVERDLERLLNATALPQHEHWAVNRDSAVGLESFPLVEQSVLNFGLEEPGELAPLKDLSLDLAARIKRVIERHEPRARNVFVRAIDPRELKADAEKKLVRQKLQMGVLDFEIQAELYAEPLPEYFRVKTEFDLKTAR